MWLKFYLETENFCSPAFSYYMMQSINSVFYKEAFLSFIFSNQFNRGKRETHLK